MLSTVKISLLLLLIITIIMSVIKGAHVGTPGNPEDYKRRLGPHRRRYKGNAEQFQHLRLRVWARKWGIFDLDFKFCRANELSTSENTSSLHRPRDKRYASLTIRSLYEPTLHAPGLLVILATVLSGLAKRCATCNPEIQSRNL